MPNEEWGVKRLCPTTGKRFYDLNKNPIVSPYTGEAVEIDTTKSRMIEADAEDAASLKAKQNNDSDDAVLDDDDDAVDGEFCLASIVDMSKNTSSSSESADRTVCKSAGRRLLLAIADDEEGGNGAPPPNILI